MSKQTKIVATISDIRCDVDFIRSLYNAGMNVVRMNSAHMNLDGFRRIVNNVREVSPKIGILMDTKGPEIRTTSVSQPIELKTGEIISVLGDPDKESSGECIYVSYRGFVSDINVGTVILFDDGEIAIKVVDKKEECLICEVQNDGLLGGHKSVNVPGTRISLPSLTERDKQNINIAIDLDIDFIAHSFVRTKQDVLEIQKILDERKSDIKVIAKIENQEGVDNADEILEVAYGLMVARGDLGIEVPQEKIPGIQRVLIRKAIQAKKPVIIATQMLHSMIQNPRPTRAEITDIANAIYYRTDALMLSGETAYGKYPLEAVQTMAKIAEEAEKTKLSENDIPVPETLDVVSYLCKTAVEATAKLPTKAIITDSYSGRTARYLAAYRSKNPLLAICHNEYVMRQLALSYGVFPQFWTENTTSTQYFKDSLNRYIDQGVISKDDLIVYISGAFKIEGATSFLEINFVSKLLDSNRFNLPEK